MSLKAVEICRTCCTESDNFKSLFRIGKVFDEEITLAAMLQYFSGIAFEPEEKLLPSAVCGICVRKISLSYIFKKQVLESDEYWRKMTVVEEIAEGDQAEVEVEAPEQHSHEKPDDNKEKANGLESLAAVAQIKEAMDSMEYIKMRIVRDSTDVDDDDGSTKIITVYTDVDAEEEVVLIQDAEEEVVATETEDSVEACTALEEDTESQKDGSKDNATEGMDVYFESNENTRDNSEVDTATETRTRKSVKIDKQALMRTLKNLKKVKPRAKRKEQKINDPSLKCKQCGKQLSNINSFRYHMQLHSDRTPFLCNHCGEGFKTRNAYDGHLASHDPNNPNTCEVCGKSYRQSSSLRTHMLTHTGEKPFKCNICGKGMTQKSGYKKHLLTHSGEKPHRCDICGREFRYSSNMLAHRRSHSGEKPYKCGQCGKKFLTTEQTKRHLLVHSQVRPFTCEICNKTFKRRTTLISHRNMHGTEPVRVEQKLSKSKVVEML